MTFILGMTVIVLGQDVEKKTIVNDSPNAITVVNQIFDKTTEAVTNLASALKVPAEHVYMVLVKQQTTKSIVFLTLILIGIFISIFCYKQTYSILDMENKKYRETNDKKANYIRYTLMDDGAWNVSFVFFWIFLIATVLTIALTTLPIITGFINPEYGAIKEIMNLL